MPLSPLSEVPSILRCAVRVLECAIMNDESLPPLRLPLQYFFFGNLCLLLALCGLIRYAQDFTGFYYHPRILALTHLVTLGWITANILGAMYIVAPMSLRMKLPAGRIDHAAFWIFAIGVSGMVSHFWLERASGMAWSAGMVLTALFYLVSRFLSAVRGAGAPGFVKLHLVFAFINLLIAGGWGTVVAINKTNGFLKTPVAANIYAHAHMAAVGWAAMLVFGMSYRLLPMFLPAEPAKGRLPWMSALSMEVGILGIFFSFLYQSRLIFFFALLICCGIVIFLFLAIRTALHRKPAPPPVPPKPDFAMLQVLFSFALLVLCAGAGLALVRLPSDEKTLQLALAYGFTALMGFLSQMILGMRAKILSVFTWYHAFTKAQSTGNLPRPVDMPIRIFQAFTCALWILGIGSVITGLLLARRLLIVGGASALLAGLIVASINEIVIVRLLWNQPSRPRNQPPQE